MAMLTKSCGIPGIDYDASYADKLYKSPGLLAGALGLSTSSELWELALCDPDTKPIVDGWVEERKNIGGNALSRVWQSAFEKLLVDPAMHPAITSQQHPSFSAVGRRLGNTDLRALAKLTALWYIARLIKAKPNLFPRSQVEPVPMFNAYDLLHGWKFLRWIWRESSHNTLANFGNKKATRATRPIFHIPSMAIAFPPQTTGVTLNSQGSTAETPAPVHTRDLIPNPIETPEEEEALNQAIVHGLGDGTIALEDTEPIFVEQAESVHSKDTKPLFVDYDESEHEENKTEDEKSETSELEKVPISDEYILDSDADAYDSGYESADECYDIQAKLRSRKRAKVTAGQTVHGDADQSTTV